jgi:hypothetical protein
VPVNSPLPTNVSPVMNAVTLFGSRFADVSIPRTLNSDTPPGGKKNCVSAWIVVAVFPCTHSHPILADRQIEGSLLSLREEIRVSNPISDFDDCAGQWRFWGSFCYLRITKSLIG